MNRRKFLKTSIAVSPLIASPNELIKLFERKNKKLIKKRSIIQTNTHQTYKQDINKKLKSFMQEEEIIRLMKQGEENIKLQKEKGVDWLVLSQIHEKLQVSYIPQGCSKATRSGIYYSRDNPVFNIKRDSNTSTTYKTLDEFFIFLDSPINNNSIVTHIQECNRANDKEMKQAFLKKYNLTSKESIVITLLIANKTGHISLNLSEIGVTQQELEKAKKFVDEHY